MGWQLRRPREFVADIPESIEPTPHTHGLADIEQGGATDGQALIWNAEQGQYVPSSGLVLVSPNGQVRMRIGISNAGLLTLTAL